MSRREIQYLSEDPATRRAQLGTLVSPVGRSPLIVLRIRLLIHNLNLERKKGAHIDFAIHAAPTAQGVRQLHQRLGCRAAMERLGGLVKPLQPLKSRVHSTDELSSRQLNGTVGGGRVGIVDVLGW